MGPRSWAPHFSVLFSLYIASACAQGCQIVLQLSPANSTVTLGGALVEPVQATLEPGNPGAVTGLSGELVANLPGPCPTDAAELASALASAQLSTTPSTGPLQLYPSEVTIKNGFSTLEWQEVGLNASVQLSTTGASLLQLIFAEGWINNTSLLSPNGERIEPIGINGTNATTATVQVTGAEVALTLTDFVITMQASYTNTLNGAPLSGLSDYVFSGTIVASTAVGCPSDCGPNGRCTALKNGTASCQCACGWAGAACDVPSGFCPIFPSDADAAAAAAANCPTLPPAPLPNSAPCNSGTQCTSWQQFNATTGGCQCLEGWGGPGCDACQTNDACGTKFSNAGATCSFSRPYTTETVYKAYNCDLNGTGLDDVIEPGTYFVSCNTTAPEIADGGQVTDGSYCLVQFALKGSASNLVSCKTSLCAFQTNSSTVNCQTTTCSCLSSCPDLEGVFARIEGQPTVIDCDDAGQCTFDIKDFFVRLKAPCNNHACLVPGYVMEEAAYTFSPDKDYNPLLAALPLLALVAAAAGLTGHMLVNRHFFRASAAREDVSSVGEPAKARLRPVDSVSKLAFTDICSTVRLPGGAILHPLQHVSGVVKNGELAGVLGPSGGGKTSLLEILVGSAEDRGSSASVTGAVTLDGASLHPELTKKVAYCAQDSTLLPTLTVEECVRYSALLRLPRGTSASEVAIVVDEVLGELGLQKIRASQVGGASGVRGVSGGERRRVAIAMELVTNPAILVCDEPTSGLDSYTSYSVMRILKTVAESGRIVVMSFHQPSPAMFSLLDRVFLMVQGRCAFAGTPEQVGPRFAAFGLPCPTGTTPAEHMLYCACDPETAPALLEAVTQRDAAVALTAAENGDSDSDKGSADAEAGRASGGDKVPSKERSAVIAAQVAAPAGPAVGRQLAVLFWRALVDIARNPTLLMLHWGMALAMGIFTGCIFWAVGLTVSGAQNRLGGVFFALAFFAFTSLTTTDLLMTERRVVSREVRGGYYAPWAYLASKAVLDGLLLRAIPTFLYAAAFYPMMGLNPGSVNVAVFLMTLATFAVAVGALSLAVAVGAGTPGQASLVMNLVLLLSLLMGGFFVNVAEIPSWISWLHYLSVFHYGYSVLVTNEMSTLLLNFEVEGYAAVSNVRGTTFLEIIGVDPTKMTTYIIVLDCMYVLFLLLAFALLHLRVRHLFPRLNFSWWRGGSA